MRVLIRKPVSTFREHAGENIKDYDRSKNIGFSVNLSHSFGGPGGQTDTQKTKDAIARIGDVFNASGFGVDGAYEETDKQGITRANIGAGDITIRDKEKQAELEASITYKIFRTFWLFGGSLYSDLREQENE